ncbi:hypothetical protein MSAN_00972600 [Mycena sanguinolenta]|uniref:Uncharacterized protein n=1 Tax=Mycena sanguinolenta TaxID=230812 RepID=A0A8H6YYL6_9AGAR|nr:hypothetical protein MSAN_00972600 [Mycena sanguinolenta]
MNTTPRAHPSTLQPERPIDVILGLSTMILSTLNSVAASSPIAPAVTICLALYTAACNAKGNKQSFRDLARDACELVYAVISHGEGNQTRSPTFQSDVDRMIQVLKQIEEFSTKRASRSFLYRFATVAFDAARIKKYRAELEQRLKVFNLQANVSIREMVEQILEQQQSRPLYVNGSPESPAAAPVQTAIVFNGSENIIGNVENVHGNKITTQTNYMPGILRLGSQLQDRSVSMNESTESSAAARVQTAIVFNGSRNIVGNVENVNGNRITTQTNHILYSGPHVLPSLISV